MLDSEVLEQRSNIVDELSDKQADEVIALVPKLWKNATDDIRELIDDSNEAWDYYLRNRPNSSVNQSTTDKRDSMDAKSGRRGLRLGAIPKHVDSIISMQHNNTFPTDDRFFRGTPVNKFAKESQELVEQHISLNMAESNIAEKMRQYRMNMFMDGTAAVFCPWVKEKRQKTVYEPKKVTISNPFGPSLEIPIPGTHKAVTKNVVHWEGTDAVVLNFNDWRIDPDCKRIEDSWFCTRWYEDTFELEEEYPDLAPLGSYSDSFVDNDENRREDSGLPDQNRSMSKDAEGEGKEKALVMACYNDFVLDGKVYRNHLAVMVNDQHLVWFGPNPYNHGRIPYIVAPYIPLSQQAYGLSGVKHAVPSAEVIDKIVDSFGRMAAWVGNPTFTKNMRDVAIRKSKNFYVRPGKTIPVETESPIKQLQLQFPNMSPLLTILDKAELNIEQVIGSSSIMAGDSPQLGNVTAYEIDNRVSGGNGRSQTLMTHFNNAVLEPFMYMTFENMKQYMSTDVMINERVIKPMDLKLSDFKWVITSTAATVSRNRRLANTRAFITELLPNLIGTGVLNTSYREVVLKEVRQLLRDSGDAEADNIVEMLREASEQAASQGQVPGELAAPLQGNTNGLPANNAVPNLGSIDDIGPSEE